MNSLPRSPESYRPELLRYVAEDEEADRTVAEAEQELAQLHAASAAEAAPEVP